MTGRDLIMYILENGLEDEPVFENGTLLGFMTAQQFAERMSVGVATVEVWIELGYLSDVIRVGDTTLIPMIYSERYPTRALNHQHKRSEDNE